MVKKTRWLVLGASHANGSYDSYGGWATRLKCFLHMVSVASQFEEEHLQYDLTISANTTDLLLERFEAESKTRITQGKDHIALISLGTTDSEVHIKTKRSSISIDKFRDNIGLLIDRSRTMGMRPIFIGLTPVNEDLVYPMPWKKGFGLSNESIQCFDKVIRMVCKNRNVEYIELFSTISNLNFEKDLLVDGVHMNTQGYNIVYGLIKNRLDSLKLWSGIYNDLDQQGGY